MSLYLFLDFNFSSTNNLFGLVGMLFSAVSILLYSITFFFLDFVSLFYNFWKLVLLFSTNTPVFYYKNSGLSFLHLYSSIIFLLLLLTSFFVFAKILLFLFNNNFYEKTTFFFTNFLKTFASIFSTSNFVFIFKFLPNKGEWYKPFVLNVYGGYPQILNFNSLYFRSLLIKLKSNTTLYFIYFLNLLGNLCTFVFNSVRSLVWKPLFKKTSYFGIYNSFKNKY